LGVHRAILGTAAIEQPELVAQAVESYGPERVVVGIDARDGQVLVHGWGQETGQDYVELGARLAQKGLATAIFTNVRRDGMGTGLDVAGAQRLALEADLQVIASGGVDQLDDVRRAREAGLGGAVIGRALYEGRFTLEEALKC
jgi:phosphoribosylformimino-5-aminoimidazole carboxamide ribotide isomerase